MQPDRFSPQPSPCHTRAARGLGGAGFGLAAYRRLSAISGRHLASATESSLTTLLIIIDRRVERRRYTPGGPLSGIWNVKQVPISFEVTMIVPP
jgi:hypothetical protein